MKKIYILIVAIAAVFITACNPIVDIECAISDATGGHYAQGVCNSK